MAQDILDGCTPIEGPVNSKELHKTLCADHPLFATFPFDTSRHDRRLKTLRDQVYQFKKWADYDETDLQANLLVCPIKEDIGGDPRWDGSEAQELLKADVADKACENMKPKDLRMTREACVQFSLKKFRKHLDQAKQDEKACVDNGHKYSKNVIGNKDLSRAAHL